MIYPPLSSLTDKAENKYTLVIEVAKRARQLVSGSNPLVQVESTADKPVSIAVREINSGLVTYHRD
ncbi:MAG TPA: DNA-directed RNA polymerase subunit omega [Clostridiales bacterium]|nr:DNA-directed RNA polymerase subunit omega [Clostridia bacterium]MDD4680369.1 DNA-directed RNA polymerase subunit omega [Clostridia bacterium]HCS72427.1 DNA-directed RNA polymerase subunit omega [Clostridiales bacterium]